VADDEKIRHLVGTGLAGRILDRGLLLLTEQLTVLVISSGKKGNPAIVSMGNPLVQRC